ncbi:tetratricopeptide repeat-containing sulfotransferase family protein [Ponticaulis sp.]|uniref:tetratricopeptide repeat-containing sulfotransferase family protein n=1 Tax=Ponticaulis sp. TaxID=2020902 RepID=UPI000B6C6798|nr:tetratricopeptide repeat-containing sulfotransferase family protein [Ponticaulis sp.]MAJ09500.1 protein-tyrosine sulfotransferase [Ponticaulis sp.]RPG18844.1 MAG: sulfotransferase family protein [Hyphomonadaceae bacterium TMED125]HBH89447.1 protein-tyrosine sulfotransferase [Hyphomonadaceae bacterium]|tara:strand:- start:19841 stop:21520 length:1680 start_codon:yes stop_codon:yes gene_type:complete
MEALCGQLSQILSCVVDFCILLVTSEAKNRHLLPHERKGCSVLKIARRLLAEKKYQEAHALCIRALQTNPSNGEAYFLLGQLTADHDNFVKALDIYGRARAAGYSEAETCTQISRCLIALNRRDEAVSMVRQAISAGPADALTLDTIGVVLSRAGLHDEAVAFYQKACARNPNNADYQYNRGVALQFVGRFDEAGDAFRTCLALAPDNTRARVAMVSITKQSKQNNSLHELKADWDQRPVSDTDAKLQLAHAIAKTHEDMGDQQLAMTWLEQGKTIKLATLDPREEEDRACFEAAENLATTLKISPSDTADGPIFIVGMPRTGTTLVDRIVSSHSSVTSGGELGDFSIALKRQAATKSPLVLDETTLRATKALDMKALGQRYLNSVEATLQLTGRFTDKMPLNFFYVPAILSAIPNARIICVRRNPADTVLSNYRQLFATAFSYYTYAYDLKLAARYVVKFNKLMDAFYRRLPEEAFTSVHYEQLVTNTEEEVRRLLAFCDLPFEEACMRFHESKAAVATASATQVRKPVYTSSVGRWRKCEDAMQPALEILRNANLEF